MEADKSNLRSVILDSLKQITNNLDFLNQLRLTRRPFDKITLCGMGGSALMDDFFQYFKDFTPLRLAIPLSAHNSYYLPGDADQKTLVIIVSYSGDTEEALSSFKEAQKQNLEIAGITYGGKLGELFEQNKIPWIKIPDPKIPPRFSLGYQFNGLVRILMAYGLLAPFAQHQIQELSEKINPTEIENQAKVLCQKLTNKIPIIYASEKNSLMAKLWKINFNENTKIPAFYNAFPELNHNEMVGFTKNLGPFSFLFLSESEDLVEIKNRMKLTAKIFGERHLPVDFIEIKGSSPLEKLFYAQIMGNWVSYHLALFYGIDPTPVEMVEEFKKRLKSV
jgi:glucose/mannose-6-phosphate isomerase